MTIRSMLPSATMVCSAEAATISMLAQAAKAVAAPLPRLGLKDGVITAPDGRKLTYGSLARDAAVARTRAVAIRQASVS